MLGRTPAEAVQRFCDNIQRAVSCATPAVVNVSGGYHVSPVPHVLVLSDGRPQRLRGVSLALSIFQHYRVVETADQPQEPWSVHVTAYSYTLHELDGREVLAYHWHPTSGLTFPHLHLGPGAQVGIAAIASAHLPTGQVTLTRFLRLLFQEFRVTPLRAEHDRILAAVDVALAQ